LLARFLASYNYSTGLIDTGFQPTFGGGVNAVEASPDGTRLYVAGSFNTINGVTKRKIASISLTTGAPVAGFTANAGAQATALAATNSTLYVGGNFKTVNGAARVGLAAVNGATGAVVAGFVNNMSGGIGVNGALTVQQLALTHDDTKLLVVHTGRKIANQDRYGVGLISTQTNQLLPWRTRLWDDNLQFVGGIQRVYAGDIAPNDQYFVVGSGSGGDRPPINDTAIAFPVAGNDNVQPLWVSRHFDSVYSVAVTERAVYVGGPSASRSRPPRPTPGPAWTTSATAPARAWPATASATRWSAATTSEPRLQLLRGQQGHGGHRPRPVRRRRRHVPGRQADRPGRLLRLQLQPGALAHRHHRRQPDRGPGGRLRRAVRDRRAGDRARAGPAGPVEIQDRNSKQYLQDDLVPWGAVNNIYASLATANATSTAWTLPVTITGNRELQVMAKTFAVTGGSDATKAIKKFESFSVDDQTPTTSISGPSGSVLASTTFIATGTASDDKGVNALTYWFRNASNQYLQEDGSVSSNFNTFRGTPDVVGATSATWRYEVTLPHEGEWRMSATAIDTNGQSDLRGATRDWLITSTGVAPTVAINAPAPMTPPTAAPALTVTPGSPLTFSGTANDTDDLVNRDLAAQPHHTGAAGLRWHLGHRRGPGLVPDLPVQHQQPQRQLELHHAVRPDPGPVLLQRAGHRRDRPDHLVDQPGPPHHQRPGGRGRVPRRSAELHRHRRQHRGAAPRPGRHGHRRQGRRRRPGRPRGPGHRPLRAAQRGHGGRLRHPERVPGLAGSDQHDLDTRGRPADQG
jgi:trimeric autotransporter adhesin